MSSAADTIVFPLNLALAVLNMTDLDHLKEEYPLQDKVSQIKIVEANDVFEGGRVNDIIARLASGFLDGSHDVLEAEKKDNRDLLYGSESEGEARDSTEGSMSEMTVYESFHHTDEFDELDSAVNSMTSKLFEK
jgi:hypothetical protein|tara:strand:- start:314 stop:715 length:402 start_codon:yes stop_codon:yes gene_type:complete